MASYWSLQEASQGDLPKPCIPVRHKLKECYMMKNYMTMGAIAKSKKP
jgi:hypothetical protein